MFSFKMDWKASHLHSFFYLQCIIDPHYCHYAKVQQCKKSNLTILLSISSFYVFCVQVF